MSAVNLKTSDDVIFKVERDIIRMFEAIQIILETNDDDSDDSEEEIPLFRINADTFENVILWATYHKDDDPLSPPIEKDGTDTIHPWDAAFLNSLHSDTLIQLILAVDFLNVKSLYVAACKMIVSRMKNKNAQEIRVAFDIDRNY